MSIKSYLRKLLEEDDVTDTTNIPVASENAPQVAAAPVADTSPVAAQISSVEQTAVADATSVVKDADAEVTDTDKLKEALQVAGHDVSGYWDVAVAFGKKIDADVAFGIKKALTYLESEAVTVYDEALAIAKLKK